MNSRIRITLTKALAFSLWSSTSLADIQVMWATYGQNCGVPQGNVTHYLARMCNGQPSCSFPVNHEAIGDPAFGCKKDFIVTYTCGGNILQSYASREASYGSVYLSCTPPLKVISATYGRNCGAPVGNLTQDVASNCNDKTNCTYRVDHTRIGDPKFGCAKDFIATWLCNGQEKQSFLSPEASGNKMLLHCR
jgi:hypothetical protein